MCDQYVLQTVNLLNFCGFWINPIDQGVIPDTRKRLLMFRTQETEQINSPISIVLTPPIEIDVKTRLQVRFDQAKTL